ncbi:ribosomal protein P0 (A0) (L10E), partial [Coemansia sp. 'formosensis']
IYDNGNTFSPAVLDITEEDLIKSVVAGIATISCISLAANYLTLPAVPHLVINEFKSILALSIATDYTIDAAKSIKELLDNPEAMAAAAAAASSAAAPAAASESKAAAVEEEEESDEDMGFGLFD